MNNTTLEKMKWLADQGFEPDMWRNNDIRVISICGVKGFGYWNPYFTESALWKLLPQYINDRYTLTSDKSTIGYEIIGHRKCIHYVEIKQDLHSALLDLTIWTVKEGHLKPQEVKA